MESINLTISNPLEVTRMSKGKGSCIDYGFSNCSVKNNGIVESYVSDHDMIFIEKFCTVPDKQRISYTRNWKILDKPDVLEKLLSFLELELGDSYIIQDNVNTKAEVLIEKLGKTFEKFLPLRERKRKKENAPWMNTDIKTAMRKRKKMETLLEIKN